MNEDVWIGAHDALKLVNAPSAAAAERWAETIVDRVGRGLIPTRAQALFVSGEMQEGSPIEIPASLWRAYNLQHNWLTGDFKAKPNHFAKNPIWFEAFGVEFKRSMIESMIPAGGILSFRVDVAPPSDVEQAPLPLDQSRQSRGGAPLDSEKWGNFVAAMAGYAASTGISPNLTIAKLYEAVASYAMERGCEVPHKSNVSHAVSLALRWTKGIDDPKRTIT